ncbi:MAG: ribonuclease H-like domain-containing protein [Patescibacteria group bacterium]
MRTITLDIETTGDFAGGIADPTVLELCLVGAHDSETGELTSYLKDDLPQLWSLLERADSIVGYNSDHFDLPILNKYYSGNLLAIKSVDLMKEIKNVLGRRLKLDNLAQATLGRKKSGSGLDSVKWWAAGEVEKVRHYCLEDVRITRELYDYALKHSSLKYKDFDGIRDIKLDTSDWEKQGNPSALTHTLPF